MDNPKSNNYIELYKNSLTLINTITASPKQSIIFERANDFRLLLIYQVIGNISCIIIIQGIYRRIGYL